MTSLNRVTLLGKLTKDPEIKSLSNNKRCASFTLATTESYTDKTGETKELIDYHNVVIFAEYLVKIAENHLKNNSNVYLEGTIKTRKWVDMHNNNRYITEVILNNFNSLLVLVG